MPSSIGDWYGPNSLRPRFHKRAPARLHAFADFVVFGRGFQVRRLLGFDELALEQRDFLGIVELDDVGRPVHAVRDQRTDDEHVRDTTRS